MTDLKRKIIIHIGPHRTGSTALQRYLMQNQDALAEHDVGVLHDKRTHEAALRLARKDFEQARELLGMIRQDCDQLGTSQVILSQEDFSGDLVGRGQGRRVYPTLAKNLRILTAAFPEDDVSFLFFRRQEGEWLRSCYAQHVKYRDRFSSLEEFIGFIKEPLNWASVLAPAVEYAQERLVIADYQKDNPTRCVQELFRILDLPHDQLGMGQDEPRANASASPQLLTELERVNQLASMRKLVPIYKKRMARREQLDEEPAAPASDTVTWPRELPRHGPIGLEALYERVLLQVPEQPNCPDILPAADCDLAELATKILPSDVSLSEEPRANIEDQAEILRYHLRGKSELAFLNALVISYLRRDTPHTEKARALFQRIWTEAGEQLRYELSTRWLISTLQTFLDHGDNEAQKIVGAAGFFYANMIKIYEGERALEGRAPDETYGSHEPTTKNMFRGLDRYTVGGTDLLLNTNAKLLELCMLDQSAGAVLSEFLLRTKHSGTVFSRFDDTRKAADISIPNFADTWSFFEE
ncbi:hypothetical protein QTA57_10150 [Fontisubflavum oceani]|uniref:hypothetical protein n=1 Tax=Fontisubflavum oceani TaxID=2978973 RepID=UPI0025B4CB76|nr:hypothetical protein [Fontisubflavum oceani]WJY20246.1 hypothetical protein QTA57_10150 [Fontisubflavum oceani]